MELAVPLPASSPCDESCSNGNLFVDPANAHPFTLPETTLVDSSSTRTTTMTTTTTIGFPPPSSLQIDTSAAAAAAGDGGGGVPMLSTDSLSYPPLRSHQEVGSPGAVQGQPCTPAGQVLHSDRPPFLSTPAYRVPPPPPPAVAATATTPSSLVFPPSVRAAAAAAADEEPTSPRPPPAAPRRRGGPSATLGMAETPLMTVPQTPAKQRRTVHGGHGETRLTSSASATRGITLNLRIPAAPLTPRAGSTSNGTKFLRSELSNCRKRSAEVLSQFSALDLDESVSSLSQQLQQQQQQLPQPGAAGGPMHSVAHLLFPSQPLTSQQQQPPQTLTAGPSSPLFRYTTPSALSQAELLRGGGGVGNGSFSQLLFRPSQEVLELSQADTEYSNFLARRILTDYREVRDLGHGSFGRVSLYEETSTGEYVAVKISAPLTSGEQEWRWRRERAIMGMLRGKPHIVQLSAAWEEGRVPQMYLQLEYCSGGSVADLAERKRESGEVWEENEVLVFLAHMAIALDAMHRMNIAHVDFKPENVLIDGTGGYKLSDFGCSIALDDAGRPRPDVGRRGISTQSPSRHAALSAVKGSSAPHLTVSMMPEWSSPSKTAHAGSPGKDFPFHDYTQMSMGSVDEGDCRYLCSDMLNQKKYFKAGDMYSLGMSLFELMSGEPLPRNGDAFHALRRALPTQLLLQRGYSARLVDLVVSLVQEDPESRPTARQVLHFLRPPQDALTVLGDVGAMSQWTSDVDQLCEVISEGLVSFAEVRLLNATVEASAWLLETVQQEYWVRHQQQQQQQQQQRQQQRDGSSNSPLSFARGVVGGPSSSSTDHLAAALQMQSARGDACTPTNAASAFHSWRR